MDIESLNPQARPYACAILAIGTETPNPAKKAILQGLDLNRLLYRHLAFSAYVRRMAAGESETALEAYLLPAIEAGEWAAAWQAVGWLRASGTTHRALLQAMRSKPMH